jgi:hypothetical protein
LAELYLGRALPWPSGTGGAGNYARQVIKVFLLLFLQKKKALLA